MTEYKTKSEYGSRIIVADNPYLAACEHTKCVRSYPLEDGLVLEALSVWVWPQLEDELCELIDADPVETFDSLCHVFAVDDEKYEDYRKAFEDYVNEKVCVGAYGIRRYGKNKKSFFYVNVYPELIKVKVEITYTACQED